MNIKRPALKNFFVLEGLDGSGTTSQLNLLKKYCHDNNINSFFTWEPTDNPVGLLIRKVLHREVSIKPETMARLFSADRYEHLYTDKTGIKDRASSGELVFCDRYLFSSLAYQSLENDFDLILDLNPFPLPEKVFYIQVPPEECVKRRSQREIHELFDDIALQEKLHLNYLKAFSCFSDSDMEVHIIDGTKDMNQVFESIRNLIFKR